MKKFAKTALIVLMLATCIFALVACNDNTQTQTTISIASGNMPQTVFVKGNDLDFSRGKLTVVKGGEVSEIEFNAEGVSVTGFDKNTVGSQTLTVTYGGATTTIDVSVVERVVAENAEFVIGEAIDNSGRERALRLKITKDSGDTLTVPIGDSRLTLSGFDSTSAGTKTVNAVYNDGNIELSGDFAVTIYNPDTANGAKLSLPTKRIYESHETALDMSGAYITVTANNGALTTVLQINDSMNVTGFNPSEVTENEPTKTQTINIEYPAGNFLSFTVSVRLSDVTRIERAALALSDLNWTGNSACAVSDEQGERAMAALDLLNGLSATDAALISDETKLAVVRPAVVYAKAKWDARAEQFSELFTTRYSNVPTIECVDVAVTKTQFAALSALNKNDELFTYGDLLVNKVLAAYGESVIFGDTTIGSYLGSVCSSDAIEKAKTKIDLMLKMHDALAGIPADWQTSDLLETATAEKIEAAHALVVELGTLAESFTERYLFNTVSEWRSDDKNDYFEILYRYYFELVNDADATVSEKGVNGIEDMIDVCLPGMLETYYLQFISCILEHSDIQYTVSNGYLVEPAGNMDTVNFISAYRRLVQIADAITDSDDEMIIALFNNYNMNNLIVTLLTADFGVVETFGSAFGDEAIDSVWTKYISTIAAISNTIAGSNEYSYSQNATEIEDLFKSFIELTPEQQTLFICSINPYGLAEILSPSDGTNRTTMFANIIFGYYAEILPSLMPFGEDENGIVWQLLDALQCYIMRNEEVEEDEESFIKLFVNAMSAAEEMYGELSASEKTAFDEHIGFFYEKYLGIYKLYSADGKYIEQEISEEWQDKIDMLESSYSMLLNVISAGQSNSVYPMFISLYESIVNLYNDIMTNGSQVAKDAVLYSGVDETLLYQYRTYYVIILVEYPVDDENALMAWDIYRETNLSEYISSIVDLYTVGFLEDLGVVLGDDQKLTLERIKVIMEEFRALSLDEKDLFIMMDGYGEYLYYNALHSFFEDSFGDKIIPLILAEELLDLEMNMPSMTKADFVAIWEGLAVRYGALSEADREVFDANLKEAYDYYKGVYDEITAEEVAA